MPCRDSCKRLEAIELRLNSLTPREQEVLKHIVNGKLDKQIAASPDTAEKTVKVHRGRVMRKIHARVGRRTQIYTSAKPAAPP